MLSHLCRRGKRERTDLGSVRDINSWGRTEGGRGDREGERSDG